MNLHSVVHCSTYVPARKCLIASASYPAVHRSTARLLLYVARRVCAPSSCALLCSVCRWWGSTMTTMGIPAWPWSPSYWWYSRTSRTDWRRWRTWVPGAGVNALSWLSVGMNVTGYNQIVGYESFFHSWLRTHNGLCMEFNVLAKLCWSPCVHSVLCELGAVIDREVFMPGCLFVSSNTVIVPTVARGL